MAQEGPHEQMRPLIDVLVEFRHGLFGRSWPTQLKNCAQFFLHGAFTVPAQHLRSKTHHAYKKHVQLVDRGLSHCYWLNERAGALGLSDWLLGRSEAVRTWLQPVSI